MTKYPHHQSSPSSSSIIVLALGLLLATTSNAFTASPISASTGPISALLIGGSVTTTPNKNDRGLGRTTHAKPSSEQLFTASSTANRRLRSGANSFELSALKKATASISASSSALSTFWNHPWIQAMWVGITNTVRTLLQELQKLSTNQRGLFLAVFFLGFKLGGSSLSSWKRYKDAVDIPSKYFGPKAPTLSGRVIKVSDGDTLRFYHTPTPFHSSTIDTKVEKMSDASVPIRICTIDTPETPKFGKPGQPFGPEAKARLVDMVDQRRVQVRLLSKDQYGRAVGQVYVPFSGGKCVDELMLKEGLAEVYQGMGAVYGPKGKDAYLEFEEEARQAKKGMWSQKNRESAAEYKKRTK